MSREPAFDATLPIDLHTHSNVSDGTEAPAIVMQQAAMAGLGTIALTDHDTTAGWDEAAAEAGRLGLSFVPGIEFSTAIDGTSVHMLGYLFDRHDTAMLDELARIRDSRVRRAQHMVARLAEDFDLCWDDVVEVAGEGATVGRPHIADALIRKGVVASREESFASHLRHGSKYYVPHYAPDPHDAIALIRGAGGVAVCAHPATKGRRDLPAGAIESFIEAGLGGLEIDHRENVEPGRSRLRELAAAHDLIVTGSSDYHGAGKPNRLGEHTTAPEMLERLLDLASGASIITPGRGVA